MCSLHQPSASIYRLFNRVLLLSHGRVVFYGPSDGVIQFLESSPFNIPSYESDTNPADYFVPIISGAYEGASVESLILYYQRGQLYKDLVKSGAEHASAGTKSLNSKGAQAREVLVLNKHHTSLVTQFVTLLHRQVLLLYRSPTGMQMLMSRYVITDSQL